MQEKGSFAPCLAIAIAVALPLGVVEGAETLRGPIRFGVPGIPTQPSGAPAPLGPMPRLDPIQKFITPIDPWKPGGFVWDVEGIDDQGDPFCVTNHRPTPACDPDGPRAFLHAGFDAAPAPDRVVRASAAGRVVIARPSSALVAGRSQGEGAGIVVLEHDRDGDPATGNDHLLTVYGHVDPEVVVGQVVAQGDRIALTSTKGSDHLHFGVRQGAFDPADLDVFRAFLPPTGTLGCADCNSRPLPAPAFPDLWQDPAKLFAGSPFWLSIYGERNDAASDVIETDDGYLAFGYTGDQPGTSGRSMAVRQLDRVGNLLSQRAYNASGLEAIKHVERTPDGGIIALAVTNTPTGAQFPMLVKFDAAGEPQWSRQYGVQSMPGITILGLWWEDITVTADGGYVVTGTVQESANVFQPIVVVVARLDATGNVQWIRTYNPRLFVLGIDGKGIAPTADGGFVVVAEYRSPFSPAQIAAKDLLVFRIDADGGVLWGTNVGNGFNDARAGQIEATPDGGAIVAGSRTVVSFLLPSDMWVLKLNGDGTIAWNSLYASASSMGRLAENATRLALTSDGGYVIAGQRTGFVSDPFTRDTSLVLLRLDGTGEVVGQRRLDSLGVSTMPLGLRAASDGGFLLAAGAESDCRGCQFLQDGAARFVVAHLDGELDCAGQCTSPYDLGRQPPPAAGGAVIFEVGVMTATQVDTPLTRVDTTDRRHLCDHGFFGSPPAFDPASINNGLQTVSCDRTEYVKTFLCSAGILGAQATSPVILSVNYDSLLLKARVVDGDSAPGQNDVASVTATLFASTQLPNPYAAIPMLDDGSLTSLPGLFNDVSYCTEDPVAGVCGCILQQVPAFSGDMLIGDGIYTLESSLIVPTFQVSSLDVRVSCVIQSLPRNTMLFDGTPVSVLLRATDRIGNVTSTTATVTPSGATSSCTGDACGCCLLTSSDPVSQCAGLRGMPSPDYPDGICRAF